jgi:hypothetical protein
MQTLKLYLYPIVIRVQIPDNNIFTVRNRIVYAHPIKVYQGIDNPIQIIMLNQDNKSIEVTGDVIVSIQDSVNQVVVATQEVQWTDQAKGYGTIILTKTLLGLLDQRFYKILIKTRNILTNYAIPVYTNDNYDVSLDLEVLPGYYE